MSQRRFIQVDVFTPSPIRGNALAVVVDGDGVSDEEMQRFAAWTNLAETTFIQKSSEADYRLKIFTPTREMPFAGHPTLGSCAAWLHCGGQSAQAGLVRQECGVGIVEIDINNPGMPAFTAPSTEIRSMNQDRCESILRALEIPRDRILDMAELDNGPVWQVFQLDSADTVLGLDWTRLRYPEYRGIGFIGNHQPGSECDYEVRLLAPSSGMPEDPITGSLNSALAHWLQSKGLLGKPVLISQGTSIGRHGRVAWQPLDADNVRIGGQTHIVIDGMIEL